MKLKYVKSHKIRGFVKKYGNETKVQASFNYFRTAKLKCHETQFLTENCELTITEGYFWHISVFVETIGKYFDILFPLKIVI